MRIFSYVCLSCTFNVVIDHGVSDEPFMQVHDKHTSEKALIYYLTTIIIDYGIAVMVFGEVQYGT